MTRECLPHPFYSMSSSDQITLLLKRARAGDERARHQLLDALYGELRELAESYVRGERHGHTLSPTALVNEVCVRLLSTEELPVVNRVQFRAFVARAMRNVLIDYARERGRLKRGGGQKRVPLYSDVAFENGPKIDVLALDDAPVSYTHLTLPTNTPV